jgi:hypothetical protein
MSGAANRTRTCDPVITNDVLYQLSYCGVLDIIRLLTFAHNPTDWTQSGYGRVAALISAGTLEVDRSVGPQNPFLEQVPMVGLPACPLGCIPNRNPRVTAPGDADQNTLSLSRRRRGHGDYILWKRAC